MSLTREQIEDSREANLGLIEDAEKRFPSHFDALKCAAATRRVNEVHDLAIKGLVAHEPSAQREAVLEEAAPTPDRADLVRRLVDSFLGWPLPKSLAPDCGISFDGRKPDQWNADKGWPIGTNLLTADEARQMFEYVLADALSGEGK
ncbi:MAG: hypothetical protein Q7J84_17495 [Sulfuricaulis sp.]|nr:hypothetical protein [Sulfuricaulis sp.]